MRLAAPCECASFGSTLVLPSAQMPIFRMNTYYILHTVELAIIKNAAFRYPIEAIVCGIRNEKQDMVNRNKPKGEPRPPVKSFIFKAIG